MQLSRDLTDFDSVSVYVRKAKYFIKTKYIRF